MAALAKAAKNIIKIKLVLSLGTNNE